jgi:hypothetical protein
MGSMQTLHMKNGFSATFAEGDGTQTPPTMKVWICLNVFTAVLPGIVTYLRGWGKLMEIHCSIKHLFDVKVKSTRVPLHVCYSVQ